MSHPNILLITTDQMRFDHLGLKGVRGIRTPNLDRLGREGIHFDRGYTPCPICTPARMSLLTGKFPSSHGAYSIGVTVDPFPTQTLPALLGQQGYATGLFGKSHFVRRREEAEHIAGMPNPPADFFATHTGPYAGFDEAKICTNHTTNGRPECHYRAWLDRLGVDYAQWFPDEKGHYDMAQTGAWNIPVEYHDTTWSTNNSIDFIGRQRAAERPWFCWTSWNDPHEPFVCPEPWYSSVNMHEVDLYEGYRAGEFDDKPPFYDETRQAFPWPEKYRNEPGIDVPCAFARPDLAGKEREALQATLGMVAMIDHEVGRLLAALEASGQLGNTLVIFTSDHGEIHGHHGLWHKGLYAFEDCQRVPYLAWGPGLVKARGSLPALASLVDLPRTFLSLAGAPIPQGLQGRDLSPLFAGTADRVQDETIIECQATKKIYQQTLVTERHKLIVYRDEAWGELYDLETDPDQYRNLWSDAESQSLKLDLMHRFLRLHMRNEGHVHDRLAFS